MKVIESNNSPEEDLLHAIVDEVSGRLQAPEPPDGRAHGGGRGGSGGRGFDGIVLLHLSNISFY